MAHIFLFTFTATVIGAVYIKFWKYKYWNRRGLAQFSSSLPFGYANKFIFRSSVYSDEISSVYNDIKNQQSRHGGIYIFTKPCYVPIDPQIIKRLLNSDTCSERKIFFNRNKDALFNPIYYNSGENSSILKNDFKATITPQLRELYFKEVLTTVKDYIQLKPSGEMVFPSSLTYLNAVIVKKLFFNQPVCTDKIEDLEDYIKNYSLSDKYLNTKYMLGLISSNILKLFFARVSSKRATDYFSLQLEKVVNFVKEQNIDEETFLNCIIKSSKNDLNVNDALKKILTILLGNSEAIAPCVSFCLYELAANPEIQNKLRLEVNKFDENLTMEQLDSMEYLDQVVKEGLRKYPIFPIIKRSNNTSFAIPSSTVVLDEGTDIIIPVVGLHRDPSYFENPEQFKPERFNKSNLKNFVDSTYIPFGSGERSCIGVDLARMQIKLIIFMFIKKYKEIKQSTKITLEANKAIMSPNEFVLIL